MNREERDKAQGRESVGQRLINSHREGKSPWEFGLSELVRLGKFLRLLAPLPWLWISTLAKREHENCRKNGNQRRWTQ